MHNVLQPTIIIILFVLVRAGDIALGAAVARDVLRAILYGLVALLALIALLLSVVL